MIEVLEIGGALCRASPRLSAPRHTELPQANVRAKSSISTPAANPLSGYVPVETHIETAGQFTSDEGQNSIETRDDEALVGNLAMETRRYVDLRRAHQRLDLQAKAMCRYSCSGDKVEGAKLYAKAMKDVAHPLRVWIQPYLDAMAPVESAIDRQAKEIEKLAKLLPVVDWVASVSGLSNRFTGLIVGECGAPPGEFKSVSALWKRMGLAVIDGGRQRKVAGDAAIEHGYVARRRALMWNIGESIIKQQVRSEKDDQAKKIEGTDYAIGYYGQVYLDRKAYERERVETKAQAHNRAKRYLEKRLLRELWKAWRSAIFNSASVRPTPTAKHDEISPGRTHPANHYDCAGGTLFAPPPLTAIQKSSTRQSRMRGAKP